MGELTPEAKAAIADAVRIVKEDKWDKFLKERVAKHSGTPPADPPTPKPGDPPPPVPPTPNPPPTDPPNDPAKRKSAYWGDIFEE
jgi:hypothetical protein